MLHPRHPHYRWWLLELEWLSQRYVIVSRRGLVEAELGECTLKVVVLEALTIGQLLVREVHLLRLLDGRYAVVDGSCS